MGGAQLFVNFLCLLAVRLVALVVSSSLVVNVGAIVLLRKSSYLLSGYANMCVLHITLSRLLSQYSGPAQILEMWPRAPWY